MRILSCPDETLRLQFKRCPVFKKLSEEEFGMLLPGVNLVEYAKQDLIMAEDEAADFSFMVISGHARLFHNMPDGHERLVHIVNAPDTFGIATMFRQKTYSCSASAQATCRILRIPRENIICLAEKSHDFALKVIEILGMRIRMLEKKLGSQGVRIETRLASFILHRATFQGIKDTIELDMSREDLAGMFGTARETLSRNLSHLVAQGYIAVANRKITILDRRGLESLTGMEKAK